MYIWMQGYKQRIQESFEFLKQEGITIQQNIINSLEDE